MATDWCRKHIGRRADVFAQLQAVLAAWASSDEVLATVLRRNAKRDDRDSGDEGSGTPADGGGSNAPDPFSNLVVVTGAGSTGVEASSGTLVGSLSGAIVVVVAVNRGAVSVRSTGTVTGPVTTDLI